MTYLLYLVGILFGVYMILFLSLVLTPPLRGGAGGGVIP